MKHLFKRFAALMLGVTLVYVLVACAAPTPQVVEATPVPPTAVPATAPTPTEAPAAATPVPPTAVPATAPTPTEAPAAAKVGKDTVTIAINSPASSLVLDPLVITDTIAAYAAWLLYEPLMYVSATTGVTTGLAEKFEVSDDTTYTFTLRPNAKFQDGSDLTAKDVESSWKRAQELKSPVWANVSNVEAVDDLTVKITLKSPSPTFLTDEVPYLPIVKESANALQGNAIGTGAFRLKDGTGTGTITLEPNPFYGSLQAFPVQQIELRAIADPTLALQELEKGNINLVFSASQNPPTVTGLTTRAGNYLQEYFDGCPACKGGGGGRRPPPPPPPPPLELYLFDVKFDTSSALALDGGKLPQSLLDQFQLSGNALKADATVQAVQGEDTWIIVDDNQSRLIIKEGQTLNVYQELLPGQQTP